MCIIKEESKFVAMNGMSTFSREKTNVKFTQEIEDIIVFEFSEKDHLYILQ